MDNAGTVLISFHAVQQASQKRFSLLDRISRQTLLELDKHQFFFEGSDKSAIH
jgi:hypothetical protein